MMLLLGILAVAAVAFAVWYFGFRDAPVLGNGSGTVPTQVSPPTTAGGIVDQTLKLVDQGKGIVTEASSLWEKAKSW